MTASSGASRSCLCIPMTTARASRCVRQEGLPGANNPASMARGVVCLPRSTRRLIGGFCRGSKNLTQSTRSAHFGAESYPGPQPVRDAATKSVRSLMRARIEASFSYIVDRRCGGGDGTRTARSTAGASAPGGTSCVFYVRVLPRASRRWAVGCSLLTHSRTTEGERRRLGLAPASTSRGRKARNVCWATRRARSLRQPECVATENCVTDARHLQIPAHHPDPNCGAFDARTSQRATSKRQPRHPSGHRRGR
jgi:hypothetical protein